MEAGNSSSTSRDSINNRPLCRYFASNICNRGDSCQFSHERNARPDMTCKYYLAGNCLYGEACRYDHIRRRPNRDFIPTIIQSSSRNLEPLPAKEPPSSNASPPPNAWAKPLPFISMPSADPFSMASLCSEMERIESDGLDDFLRRRCIPENPSDIPICPYFTAGICIREDACTFVHGDPCDMCGANCLHPFNEQQRREHHRSCLAEHEKAMEEAFAEARSRDKQCGICMEVIVEKQLRFGILENCKHCFCLMCIRKWRQRTDFDNKIIRSCPECRVKSDYVIPSAVWVEDTKEKGHLVSLYRQNMKQQECKYTKAGNIDDCPFGNKCFYRHMRSDGTTTEGESPRELQKRRRLMMRLNDDLLSEDEEDSLMSDVIETIVRSAAGARRNLHDAVGGESSGATRRTFASNRRD